ncbi:MAG: DUF4253 domain-containing protein [Butyrivibrio sp.]|nr:DUF4253 domain-containing protein [Butyrivibrio sp.]
MSEMADKMVKCFDYPYTLFGAGTDCSEIMSAYEEKKRIGKEKGFTPVIVPVDDILLEYWGILEDEKYSVEATIRDAASKDGKTILDARYKGYLEEFGIPEKDLVGEFEDGPDILDEYSSFVDFGSFDIVETIIFEVPTANPWEVVAYLPFGGWNDCPSPEDMVAVCKYWFDKYGAVPVTISHDIMEMSVPECVGEGNALELAKEHYAFSTDRVDQGTRTYTISEVAASLAVSKIWFFWWD